MEYFFEKSSLYKIIPKKNTYQEHFKTIFSHSFFLPVFINFKIQS